MNMDVSIIIISFNTSELLRDCLKSVVTQSEGLNYEIIVVDNASTDGSVEMVERDFDSVRLIKNEKNTGFAAANNQAIAQAKGKYILLLNPDTVVLDKAIQKTIAFADSHKEAAVVGPCVLNPDRTVQRTCSMYPSVLNFMLSSTYLYKLFPKSKLFGRELMTWWDRNDTREVQVVSGCYMLIRREAIEQVGVMDDGYFFYAEETDWCYRFNKAGWKLMFTPDARIIHYGGASSSQRKVDMMLQLRGSLLLFMKKHHSKPAYAFCCVLVATFFLVRVPYWMFRSLLSVKQREYSFAVFKAYLKGFFKSFGGAKQLCIGD